MEIFLLLGIIALFFIPSFLMMRKQRQHQANMAELQAQLSPGDYVITGAGTHGRVVEVGESTVNLEVAPGTVITIERIAVMRNATAQARQAPETGQVDVDKQAFDGGPTDTERGDDHPENFR